MGKRAIKRTRRTKKGGNMMTVGYKGPMKLYNPVRPRILTVEATATTYAATTGAGAINFSFTMGQFGFSGATYPLTCPMTSTSSYQVRCVAATAYYTPIFGPSHASGVGTGVAVTVHESTLSSVTITNVLGILGWKRVRHGSPFKLQWRCQNINESLWYSGGTASLASSPSPGFLMVAATTGGAVSITIGEIFFSLVLQVREQ
jgi:hypothetical protein